MRYLCVLLLAGLLPSLSVLADGPLIVQLVDGQNKSVQNGWVEIWRAATDEFPIISGPADKYGRFQHESWPHLEKVLLRAVACPFKVRELTITLPQTAVTVTLEQEESLSEACNLPISKTTAALRVRVRSMECLPLRKTQVTLSSKVTGYVERKGLDISGIAVFTAIPPGTDYLLKAEGEPGYCTVVKKFPDLKAGSVESADLKACGYEADEHKKDPT